MVRLRRHGPVGWHYPGVHGFQAYRCALALVGGLHVRHSRRHGHPGRGNRRHPQVPPLRHRPHHQPYPRLRILDRERRRSLRAAGGRARGVPTSPGQFRHLAASHRLGGRPVPAAPGAPAARRQPPYVRRARRAVQGALAPRPSPGRGARPRYGAQDHRGDGSPGAQAAFSGDRAGARRGVRDGGGARDPGGRPYRPAAHVPDGAGGAPDPGAPGAGRGVYPSGPEVAGRTWRGRPERPCTPCALPRPCSAPGSGW
jgi:hypothetical protein